MAGDIPIQIFDGNWSVWVLMALFGVAALAGWVDTLAGGGGLLTLPALILVGVPPVSALATNKSQSFAGTLTASISLLARKQLNLRTLWPMLLAAALGSAIGCLIVQSVSTDWLRWFVPVLLLAVALYFLLTPALGDLETLSRMTPATYSRTVMPLIGLYDGAIGPGTGSFFAAAGVVFRGFTLRTSTIQAKPLNFTTNIVALAMFSAGGQVVWLLGAVMMAGQVLGAWLASHMILTVPLVLIRRLVITMCLLMSIAQLYRLLY